jgi:putative GTP pyrophosphokinase
VTAALSKTQVDKLGDRLRKGDLSESDLRNLDEYRRSFGQGYDIVVGTLRERLRLKPTGRPAKSTGALVEKLRRESIRLVQVQDIAGCRVVVPNVARQQEAVGATCREFPDAVVVDRRSDPSYGYPL